MADENSSNLIEVTGMVAASYFENNRASVDEIPTVISAIHSALKNLGETAPAAEPAADEFKKPTPGQIRKSITPER